MGTFLKLGLALCVGVMLLAGAEQVWMSAMQRRIESTRNDTAYSAPAHAATNDIAKMGQ